MSAREWFPHPYKECFVLLPNRCGISQSTPLRVPASSLTLVLFSNRCGTPQSTPFQGPTSLLAHRLLSTLLQSSTSLLAHRPMCGSDTICNDPSPSLANIVLFGLSLSGFPSRFLNVSTRERFPHPYKECLPNRCGISQHISQGRYK